MSSDESDASSSEDEASNTINTTIQCGHCRKTVSRVICSHCSVITSEVIFANENGARELGYERVNIFKAQENEDDNFDVSFEVDGTIIHANKYVLQTVSAPLKAMMSSRWSKPDEIIKIQKYSSECFYEFLLFLYSGKCQLLKINVIELVDMSEFYGVTAFKNYCETFLVTMTFDADEFFDLIGFAEKYSLSRFSGIIKTFFLQNFTVLFANEKFLSLEKSVIKLLSTYQRETSRRHTVRTVYLINGTVEVVRQIGNEVGILFFNVVCNWAEHQALKKQEEEPLEDFNLENAIKEELTDILPNLNLDGCHFKYIMSKQFLFSFKQFLKILLKCSRSSVSEESYVKEIMNFVEKRISNNEAASEKSLLSKFMKSFVGKLQFSQLTLNFYMNFVVKKSCPYPDEFEFHYTFLTKCKKFDDQEDLYFQMLYDLTEKHVIKNQQKSPTLNFNVFAAVKNKIFEDNPPVNFYRMTQQFIADFVVAKGLLSEDESRKIWNVEVWCDDNKFVGSLINHINIFDSLFLRKKEPQLCKNVMKHRFTDLKFKVPRIPILSKMKGCDWYLCLEEDGILTMKHSTLCKHDDYLLTEMKCAGKFSLKRILNVQIYANKSEVF